MPDFADAPVLELFRRESARLCASVQRIVRDLDVAEEIVQETLLVALQHFREHGVPENVGAWAMVAARRRALDHLRHRRVVAGSEGELAEEGARMAPSPEDLARRIPDDRLRLVFTCCHPSIPSEGRVALTLRLVAGLTTGEIARAFLVPEPTVAQRIVRAKKLIADERIPYEVPEGPELLPRVASVLEVVYLVFNEGYTAHGGSALVRESLCDEAIRLAGLVLELMPGEGDVLGLLALMELQAARTPARVDERGELVLLPDQNRSLWSRLRIERGLAALVRARTLGPLGSYALQAEIAACHAVAPTWETTDFRRIVSVYDALMAVAPSPVVELNRAVAVAMADGPEAGLLALAPLERDPALRGYHHLPSTRADFLRRLGRMDEAAAAYREALDCTHNEAERTFLEQRIAECVRGLS